MSRAFRHLYITRHGEASRAGVLTANGERQAVLLGERLRGVPLAAVHHGPLPRARRTAELIIGALGDRFTGTVHESAEAGDYVPYVPRPGELPADSVETLTRFVSLTSAEERERGPALARAALRGFTGPVDGDQPRHELLVTHNFLIGWLVRAALDAPDWRWLGVNHCNAALTVIRYAPGIPASVMIFNDMAHLPSDLRWTGFPPELRPEPDGFADPTPASD